MLFYFVFFKQKTAYEMRISDWSSDVCSSDLSTIVGVVDDVPYRSVRDPLQPIFYLYDTGIVSQLMIRFQGRSPSAVYDQVETVWQRLVPDIPFQARFVDDIVNDLYNRDERRAQLFGAFAVLAAIGRAHVRPPATNEH